MNPGQRFDLASRGHSEVDLVVVRTLHGEPASACNSISGLRQPSESVFFPMIQWPVFVRKTLEDDIKPSFNHHDIDVYSVDWIVPVGACVLF